MNPRDRERFAPIAGTLRDGRQVTLRLLDTADGDRLAAFYSAVPPADVRFYCPHDLDREHALRNAAAAADDTSITLVACSGQTIVGYCWVRRRHAAEHQATFGLCVARSHQNCGLASALMEVFFAIVDEVGPPVVNLTVQVANEAAVHLYHRFGFRIVRRGIRRSPRPELPDEPQYWMQRVRDPDRVWRRALQVRPESCPETVADAAFGLLSRTVGERTGLVVEITDGDADIVLALDAGLSAESYRMSGGHDEAVRIEGSDQRGLMAGLGRFLRGSRWGPGTWSPGAWRGESTPVNPVRAVYFATHFHNWYHDAPVGEVVRYIEELSLSGCNCLSVWFDLHHYSGMEDPDARAMIARLRAMLEAANRVGIGASLTMLANEGFASTPDRLKATNAVQNGYHASPGGFYHTEICPSQPGGMELILGNRDAVLQAFAGIRFDYIWIWPYDQGGCTCSACAPWGTTGFLRTAEPVAELVRQRFPDARIVLSTWYFDRFVAGEWERFSQWVEQTRPTWFDMLLVDGFGAFPEYPLKHGIPADLPVVGFPEISMQGNSPWGGYGSNPRPDHWRDYWSRSNHLQIGNFPYSEGIYEDVNKFIMLQLNWNPGRDVDDILREYAAGYIAAEMADELVDVFHQMEADEGTAPVRNGDVDFANPGRLPEAESCAATVTDMDGRLDAAARRSWRWRLICLRARIDAELKRSGMRFTDRLEEAFRELTDLYHATPGRTRACVCPPQRRT